MVGRVTPRIESAIIIGLAVLFVLLVTLVCLMVAHPTPIAPDHVWVTPSPTAYPSNWHG